MSVLQTICLALLAALLVRAAWTDVRHRIISNRLNAAVAVLAVPWWLAIGLAPWPGMAMQVGIGLAIFALFALLFAFGLIGGGDVKLLGALGLWLPPAEVPQMLTIMALAGGLLAAAMLVRHRLRPAAAAPQVPYGVAIVVAAIPFIANRILTMAAA